MLCNRPVNTYTSTSSSFHILLLLFCSLMPSCHAVVCQPSCYGHAPGDMVPDPLSCHRYYLCTQNGTPTDAPILCPETTPIFDAELGACSDTAPCLTQCLKPCQDSCTGSFDVVGDPLDCGTYYVCIPDGVQDAQHCPPERPYFNGEVCGGDPDVCCDNEDRCVPMCPEAATQIIDPRDCRRYYVCKDPGLPLPEDHFACGEGEVFDVFWGGCSPEAKCYTLCYD